MTIYEYTTVSLMALAVLFQIVQCFSNKKDK